MKGSKGARGASQTAKKHKPKINIRKKKSNDIRKYQANQVPTSQRSTRHILSSTTRPKSMRKDSRNFLQRQDSRAGSSVDRAGNNYFHKNVTDSNTQPQGLLKTGHKDSKLRIARPPRTLIRVSENHWNQLSSQIQSSTHKRPTTLLQKNLHKEDEENLESFTDRFEQPTGVTKDTPNHHYISNYKTFSFLSNLGGKELITPTVERSIYDRSYFPKQRNAPQDMFHSKVTIITDANVDQHEFGIYERRIQRKNIMDLTARGVIEPHKTKMFRPSSSRPTLRIKQPPIINMENQGLPQKEIHSRVVTIKEPKRRPMSANPKFVTISGRNRPLSAQIQMGERRFDRLNESIDSMDKESDDLNIQEISEVPKFNETDEQHVKAENQKFSRKIMNSQPTTASIFKQDRDFNLPYPDLFDRTERTFAACYAKFGNLSYFTAVQRIGCYMDFSSRLKRRHLNDIIQYIKNSDVKHDVDEEEKDEDYPEK